MIEEEDCGYVVRNGDGESLVAAIRQLQRESSVAHALGLRGRQALERSYSMQHACEEWRRLLGRVVPDSSVDA